MSEDERDQNETPEDPDTGPSDSATDDAGDLQAQLDKWKALARENEKRAKANAEAAKKLQEIEDSKKSELEKLSEAQQVAERRAAEAEQRAMRLEVAAEKGLTPAQAKRLVGATREELEADADELLETFKPAEEESETDIPRRPRERLRGGATPTTEPEENDPRKLAAGLRSY